MAEPQKVGPSKENINRGDNRNVRHFLSEVNLTEGSQVWLLVLESQRKEFLSCCVGLEQCLEVEAEFS